MTNIATARQFFVEIAEPDAGALTGSGITLRNAFHACISLFSLRDWIVKDQSGKTWCYKGAPQGAISDVGSLQASLVQIEPSFLVVSNVANSAKHMTLNNWSWKRMEGSANVVYTSTTSGGIGGAPIGGAPIGGSVTSISIVANLGTNFHDVVACVKDVTDMWRRLLNENGW